MPRRGARRLRSHPATRATRADARAGQRLPRCGLKGSIPAGTSDRCRSPVSIRVCERRRPARTADHDRRRRDRPVAAPTAWTRCSDSRASRPTLSSTRSRARPRSASSSRDTSRPVPTWPSATRARPATWACTRSCRARGPQLVGGALHGLRREHRGRVPHGGGAVGVHRCRQGAPARAAGPAGDPAHADEVGRAASTAPPTRRRSSPRRSGRRRRPPAPGRARDAVGRARAGRRRSCMRPVSGPVAAAGPDTAAIDAAAELLASAAQPMIMVGGGAQSMPRARSRSWRSSCRRRSSRSAAGAGSSPTTTISASRAPRASSAGTETDVVLGIGSRLELQWFRWAAAGHRPAIVNVDIDPRQVARLRPTSRSSPTRRGHAQALLDGLRSRGHRRASRARRVRGGARRRPPPRSRR